MQKVSSNWIKTIFLYGVIGFMGYMTYSAVMLAMANQLAAILSIFLFDGGAYSGYKMFTGDAEGAHQRHAARVILWIDFVLAGFMVAGGLTLLHPHSILYVMLVSAVFNGGVLYYYETHQPDTLAQMQEQDEQDAIAIAAARNRKKLHKEALRQADVTISKQAIGLGNVMARRATAQLKYDMRLPMTEQELKALREDVIEAEVAELPAPAGVPQAFGFWDYFKTFFYSKAAYHAARYAVTTGRVLSLTRGTAARVKSQSQKRIYRNYCGYCGQLFETEIRTQNYCRPAHKQAAYRDRKRNPVEPIKTKRKA